MASRTAHDSRTARDIPNLQGYTLMRAYELFVPRKEAYKVYAIKGKTTESIWVKIHQFSFEQIGGKKVFEKEHKLVQKKGTGEILAETKYPLPDYIRREIVSIFADAKKSL